eukprot:s3048_g11.t1
MLRSGLPNPCFAYLQRIGYAVSYSAEALPASMRGQSRLDAIPVQGPVWCGPSQRERRLHHLQQERALLDLEYSTFEVPEDYLTSGERVASLLTHVTQQWFRDFCAANYCPDDVVPLRDRWIDLLCCFPGDFDSWLVRTFLAWGRHLLPHFVATLLDGDAERLIDDAFADFVYDLHEYQLEMRINQLDRRIEGLSGPEHSAPHRDRTSLGIVLYLNKKFLAYFVTKSNGMLIFFRFGAPTVKPTGLLTLRLPWFLRGLYSCALAAVQRPVDQAIGLDAEGHFRTAVHKEYPAALSLGLAHALAMELQRSTRAGKTRLTSSPAPAALDWISEVTQSCTEIREHAHWLPDFQPDNPI